MKKITAILFTIVLSGLVLVVGFNHRINVEPKTYYQVYLDDQIIGTINSKKALEKYIDDQGSYYKEKYGVDKIYAPEGIEIRKITTYSNKTDSIEDVYKKISKLKPFTIKGYQFLIKGEEENIVVYTTKEDIFKTAVENTLKSFVGDDTYEAYIEDNQLKIETVGTYIDNVYIEEDITIKEVQISVEETIYTNEDDLSQYLLFGTNEENKTYTVLEGQTISDVAYANKINVSSFLISNPEFTSKDNTLYPGQQIKIGMVNPIFNVVVEETVVEDQVKKYAVEEITDDTMILGDRLVIQEGINGLERVTSTVKVVNGEVAYVVPLETVELEPVTNEKVKVGSRYQSDVGTLYYWQWPTNTSPYAISSGYEWRYNPFTGSAEFHQGLDIWNSYWSPVYAANNGVVMNYSCHWSYGNCLVINHNNGYYTLYAHMSSVIKSPGQVVGMGDLIGYVGATGSATGPHLHFEVWVGGEPWKGTHINPRSLF